MSRVIKAPEVVLTTITSFDGKHSIQFNEKTHRYKWICECHAKLASVGTTTFIKSSYPTSIGLIRWMQQQALEYFYKNLSYPIHLDQIDRLMKEAKTAHENVAQEAADIGTICHAYAEFDSLGKREEAKDLLNKVRTTSKWNLIESCISKYDDWAGKEKSELVLAEKTIASPKYLFCGTLDRCDRINGKLRLRDYKTSKDIYLDQFIQLAMYRLALKEWLNMDIDELEVVRFGKEDGSFETLVIDDPKEIQMFTEQGLRCRETYDFLKMNSDPRFDWKKR